MPTKREAPHGLSADHADDLNLVELIQTGNAGAARLAFEVLVGRHGSRLLEYLQRLGLTRTEVDDVVNETWLRAGTAISRFEYRGRPFFAWLKGIAKNVCREHFRRRYLSSPGEPPLGDQEDERTRDKDRPPATDLVAHREFLAAVRRVLPEAPESFQEVIQARFELDCDTDELQELLGWSKSKIYTTQHRALRWLRERLEREYGPDCADHWLDQ